MTGSLVSDQNQYAMTKSSKGRHFIDFLPAIKCKRMGINNKLLTTHFYEIHIFNPELQIFWIGPGKAKGFESAKNYKNDL